MSAVFSNFCDAWNIRKNNFDSCEDNSGAGSAKERGNKQTNHEYIDKATTNI